MVNEWVYVYQVAHLYRSSPSCDQGPVTLHWNLAMKSETSACVCRVHACTYSERMLFCRLDAQHCPPCLLINAGAICGVLLWPLPLLVQTILPLSVLALSWSPFGAVRFSFSCFWRAAILFFVALFSSLRRPPIPSPGVSLFCDPTYINLLLTELILRRSRLVDGRLESRSRFADGIGMMW